MAVTSATIAHQPALLALPVAILDCLALVVKLLAARQRQLDLGPAAGVEIDRQRDQRHALACDAGAQTIDLALVEQQLSRPLRLMVVTVAMAELGDVGVDQEDLVSLHLGIALGDRALAEAQRLHLGAGQRDAGLEDLVEKI